MRSVSTEGIWTDEEGNRRNARVEIVIDGTTARVTVAAVDDPGVDFPTADRRIAYYLGRVEEQIRVTEYRNRTIVPDPKEGKTIKRKRV